MTKGRETVGVRAGEGSEEGARAGVRLMAGARLRAGVMVRAEQTQGQRHEHGQG